MRKLLKGNYALEFNISDRNPITTPITMITIHSSAFSKNNICNFAKSSSLI